MSIVNEAPGIASLYLIHVIVAGTIIKQKTAFYKMPDFLTFIPPKHVQTATIITITVSTVSSAGTH